MASLYSYRTADSSKKITTYVYHNKYFNFAFDFGSIDIPINDIKEIDYIFISHEHMDHFLGLLNMDYAEALLKNKCEIYASNVTKDLLIALFENVYRVDLDKKEIRTIRELLNSIKGVLFFEKYNLNKHAYFRIFPSGHTFGSAMIYLHDEEHKILYTGDIDFSLEDSDRQYQLDLKEGETIDYVIADGTYLDSETFKDEEFTQVRDNILYKKFNNFYCKPEKIVFFSKKLLSSPKLKDKYCIVFSSEFKWYLEILKKYSYDPFILDQIVLESSLYYLPENRIPLRVSSKKKDKQSNVTSLVGLHISFLDFAYMLQPPYMDSSKTTILVGHYNEENKQDILDTFHSSDITCDYKVVVLKKGEYKL